MRLVTGAVAASLLTGLVAVSPGVDSAGAATLGLTSIQDLVVDQSHGRVFLSGGALVTADLTAAPTGTVAGITAARQMALTPDGTQLVVANADGLTVVDTATASVVRTIPTGPNSCPDAIAPAAGRMFFSYGDCPAGTPGLGAVDLGTDTVTKNISTGSVVLAADQAVVLESVAAAPDVLVLRAGSTLAVLDATAVILPTVVVRTSKSFVGGPGRSVALNPAGTEIVTDAGFEAPIRAFSTIDLSTVRDYPLSEPGGTAFRSDGRLALSPGKNVNVSLFAPNGTYLKSMGFLPSMTAVADRGLAFGSERLYAAAIDYSGETPVFSLYLAPVGPPAALKILADRTIYRYKQIAVITVYLQASTPSRTVKVYKRMTTGQTTLLKTLSVPSSTGKTSFQVQVTKNFALRAEFAGDSEYAAVAKERHVSARSLVTASSASTSYTSDGFHRLKGSPAPTVTFTLAPAKQGVCIEISAITYVNGHWVTFGAAKCLYTTSNSRVSVRLVGFPSGRKVSVSARAKATSTNLESEWVKYRVLIT